MAGKYKCKHKFSDTSSEVSRSTTTQSTCTADDIVKFEACLTNRESDAAAAAEDGSASSSSKVLPRAISPGKNYARCHQGRTDDSGGGIMAFKFAATVFMNRLKAKLRARENRKKSNKNFKWDDGERNHLPALQPKRSFSSLNLMQSDHMHHAYDDEQAASTCACETCIQSCESSPKRNRPHHENNETTAADRKANFIDMDDESLPRTTNHEQQQSVEHMNRQCEDSEYSVAAHVAPDDERLMCGQALFPLERCPQSAALPVKYWHDQRRPCPPKRSRSQLHYPTYNRHFDDVAADPAASIRTAMQKTAPPDPSHRHQQPVLEGKQAGICISRNQLLHRKLHCCHVPKLNSPPNFVKVQPRRLGDVPQGLATVLSPKLGTAADFQMQRRLPRPQGLAAVIVDKDHIDSEEKGQETEGLCLVSDSKARHIFHEYDRVAVSSPNNGRLIGNIDTLEEIKYQTPPEHKLTDFILSSRSRISLRMETGQQQQQEAGSDSTPQLKDTGAPQQQQQEEASDSTQLQTTGTQQQQQQEEASDSTQLQTTGTPQQQEEDSDSIQLRSCTTTVSQTPAASADSRAAGRKWDAFLQPDFAIQTSSSDASSSLELRRESAGAQSSERIRIRFLGAKAGAKIKSSRTGTSIPSNFSSSHSNLKFKHSGQQASLDQTLDGMLFSERASISRKIYTPDSLDGFPNLTTNPIFQASELTTVSLLSNTPELQESKACAYDSRETLMETSNFIPTASTRLNPAGGMSMDPHLKNSYSRPDYKISTPGTTSLRNTPQQYNQFGTPEHRRSGGRQSEQNMHPSSSRSAGGHSNSSLGSPTQRTSTTLSSTGLMAMENVPSTGRAMHPSFRSPSTDSESRTADESYETAHQTAQWSLSSDRPQSAWARGQHNSYAKLVADAKESQMRLDETNAALSSKIHSLRGSKRLQFDTGVETTETPEISVMYSTDNRETEDTEESSLEELTRSSPTSSYSAVVPMDASTSKPADPNWDRTRLLYNPVLSQQSAGMTYKDRMTSITHLLNSMNSITQLLNTMPLQAEDLSDPAAVAGNMQHEQCNTSNYNTPQEHADDSGQRATAGSSELQMMPCHSQSLTNAETQRLLYRPQDLAAFESRHPSLQTQEELYDMPQQQPQIDMGRARTGQEIQEINSHNIGPEQSIMQHNNSRQDDFAAEDVSSNEIPDHSEARRTSLSTVTGQMQKLRGKAQHFETLDTNNNRGSPPRMLNSMRGQQPRYSESRSSVQAPRQSSMPVELKAMTESNISHNSRDQSLGNHGDSQFSFSPLPQQSHLMGTRSSQTFSPQVVSLEVQRDSWYTVQQKPVVEFQTTKKQRDSTSIPSLGPVPSLANRDRQPSLSPLRMPSNMPQESNMMDPRSSQSSVPQTQVDAPQVQRNSMYTSQRYPVAEFQTGNQQCSSTSSLVPGQDPSLANGDRQSALSPLGIPSINKPPQPNMVGIRGSHIFGPQSQVDTPQAQRNGVYTSQKHPAAELKTVNQRRSSTSPGSDPSLGNGDSRPSLSPLILPRTNMLQQSNMVDPRSSQTFPPRASVDAPQVQRNSMFTQQQYSVVEIQTKQQHSSTSISNSEPNRSSANSDSQPWLSPSRMPSTNMPQQSNLMGPRSSQSFAPQPQVDAPQMQRNSAYISQKYPAAELETVNQRQSSTSPWPDPSLGNGDSLPSLSPLILPSTDVLQQSSNMVGPRNSQTFPPQASVDAPQVQRNSMFIQQQDSVPEIQTNQQHSGTSISNLEPNRSSGNTNEQPSLSPSRMPSTNMPQQYSLMDPRNSQWFPPPDESPQAQRNSTYTVQENPVAEFQTSNQQLSSASILNPGPDESELMEGDSPYNSGELAQIQENLSQDQGLETPGTVGPTDLQSIQDEEQLGSPPRSSVTISAESQQDSTVQLPVLPRQPKGMAANYQPTFQSQTLSQVPIILQSQAKSFRERSQTPVLNALPKQSDYEGSNPHSINPAQMLIQSHWTWPKVDKQQIQPGCQNHPIQIPSHGPQQVESMKKQTADNVRKSLSNTVDTMLQELSALETRSRHNSLAYGINSAHGQQSWGYSKSAFATSRDDHQTRKSSHES